MVFFRVSGVVLVGAAVRIQNPVLHPPSCGWRHFQARRRVSDDAPESPTRNVGVTLDGATWTCQACEVMLDSRKKICGWRCGQGLRPNKVHGGRKDAGSRDGG